MSKPTNEACKLDESKKQDSEGEESEDEAQGECKCQKGAKCCNCRCPACCKGKKRETQLGHDPPCVYDKPCKAHCYNTPVEWRAVKHY